MDALKKHLLMRRFLTIFALCLFWMTAQSAKLVPFNITLLEQLKVGYERGEPSVSRYIEAQERYAAKFLTGKTYSVATKKKLPPTMDARDYMTLSPYWWPDTTKADGLPYIRRDGERNPEVYDYPERETGGLFGDAACSLGMLYYITGNEKYAEACAKHLRSWFTDSLTGMNPNMRFAQHVPGMKTLRGTGIIDSRRFIKALGAAKLIEESRSWTEDDTKRLTAWTAAFCYWLENSTQGRRESHAGNNHGLWYEAVHIMVLSYLDRADRVREVVMENILPKLDAQIATDGSLPQELKRTLSLHYCTFALEALVEAGHITSQMGINLWSTPTSHGKTAEMAVEYLLPYYLGTAEWKHKQIKPFERQRAAVILYEAGTATSNKRLVEAAQSIGLKSNSTSAATLPYLLLKTK